MKIKRVVNGKEREIELTEKETKQILEQYLSKIEQHLIFVQDDKEEKRPWQD